MIPKGSRKTAFLLLMVTNGLAVGQTAAVVAPVAAPVAVPVPTSTVNTAALPGITVGAGPSWQRGNTYPLAMDTTLALHIGSGNWYSWTDITTPMTATAAGAPPVPSTMTTGGAWIAAQTTSGTVSLVTIVQAGFSTVQATSTTAPTFTGSIGVTIRLGKSHTYVMPYFKAGNAATGSNGSIVSFVMQPGIQLLYGFGGK